MKTITNIIYPAFALFAFACFALSPAARAVLPAPDGGYPNNTTAEGEDALFSLTTGFGNTALGFHALYTNTTGNGNTATGDSALTNNTGDSNTADGAGALQSNTTGFGNTASGNGALFNNTTGNENMATGYLALQANATGSDNTATGYEALLRNNGDNNTANGSGPSIVTQPATPIRRPAVLRYLATQRVRTIPLSATLRLHLIPRGTRTRPPALMHSIVIQSDLTIQPTAFRCFSVTL